jgi:hypothetical protein
MVTPKAFVSHASEDKERFVSEFAKKLRAKGIDAWLDSWEIKPGDSLVSKIFEEGIKNAAAFIVVISATSLNKPWVREELDSGMVHKINKLCRLIPVVIDDCEVPLTLQHLKWVKIRDLTHYDNELAEICNAIFGLNDKPALGAPPPHFTASVTNILPDLTKADNLIFGVLCRHYLKKGEMFFQTAEVSEELMALGFSEVEIDESLRILGRRHYIEIKTIQGVTIWAVKLYSSSLDDFLRVEVAGYDEMLLATISGIVNKELDSNTTLHEQTSIAMPIILHFLNSLKDRGMIKTYGPAGFQLLKIMSVSPELKRILRQNN